MKNKQAFTLIELLVVVLIIGILAAVALPQYQKVVEKARATEGLVMLKAIATANKAYYMANGEYATDIEALDIDVPGENTTLPGHSLNRKNSKWFEYGTVAPATPNLIAVANRLPRPLNPYAFSYNTDDIICCYGRTEQGIDVCKRLSNNHTKPGYSSAENLPCYQVQ